MQELLTLHNLYENYDRFRRELMEKENIGEADMQEVYRLRRIQGYLEGQAGQLEQLIREETEAASMKNSGICWW